MYQTWYLFGSAQITTIRRLIRASNLISRTQLIFTTYNGLQCLSVKMNYSNLCISFDTWKVRRLKRSRSTVQNHVGRSILIHGLTQIKYVGLNCFKCGSLHVLNWRDENRYMKSSTFELGLKRIIWNGNFVRGTVPKARRESNEEIWHFEGSWQFQCYWRIPTLIKYSFFLGVKNVRSVSKIVEIKGAVSRNLSKFKQWELPPNWVNHKNNNSKH